MERGRGGLAADTNLPQSPHAQPGSLLEAFEPICLTRDGLGLVSRAVSAWYQHFFPATARLKR